ncbi:bifunctional proline dehydrogenase/L-glutamate gamma-semialdehyde dehydrogenase PutA [Psychromonas sp. RZ22]|uniref:bifunctional proline dehydrogenase/L-glutamate gamma-semialdehyde dehydrogenase PutA n=1 Tax=Psychromonas algarum TaxID=2555643 RepID=UPI001068CFDF|nr:bifunctional proline dehydrogenase/L-glutamate gamma-semialdehyde dehydrogenase PutA [Psychromonas sp. RZ22]TEW55175.1 bifunctional proline dehydrogenase/L-glutamate gamma-semialdehyde dehydrogenase PutA [Psychromonas sp. RZ22]
MPSFTAVDTLQKDFIDSDLNTLWAFISPLYMVNEGDWLKQLIAMAEPTIDEKNAIDERATELIVRVRKDKNAIHMIDALLLEYSLDTKEGILLMCLAEALMRIPDAVTADALIKDKLSIADWTSHLKKSDSLFVNASTWGLLLTGKVVNLGSAVKGSPSRIVNRLVSQMSEPVIRQAMHQAMKIMGHQFVLGRNIEEAQKNAKRFNDKGFSYSFDMLGESALTATDAKKYFNAYMLAIESIGKKQLNQLDKSNAATVSIKLSALHPRYEVANKQRVHTEMLASVLALIGRARELNVGLTIDAEEADRLELSLSLFEKLYQHPVTQGWGKLGIVVQAYSKRALPVLVWLAALAKQQGDVIPLRLVKGAYWDSELKLSQQNGYAGYPVYTRKEATDVSYLACSRFLLSEHIKGLIYPQFASHNAHTVVAITAMASHSDYEFQRLHGMGDALYNHVLTMFESNVRIYAPVGSHKDLLPYLVRRLLENGANSSFVHRLVDANCPIETLTEHPVTTLKSRSTLHNGLIVLPPAIFDDRKNSSNINIDIESEASLFEEKIAQFKNKTWHAGPIVNGVHYINQCEMLDTDTNDLDNKNIEDLTSAKLQLCSTPYDRSINIGSILFSTPSMLENALNNAQEYYSKWNETAVQQRAQYLYKLADLLEENVSELIALCHHEAGKTIHDSIDEVREAVDFCRYYAQQATVNFAIPETKVSFDNVTQQVSRQGKGVFVCISPWNFPLAIFLGQVTAALVTGNTVVAKPAEQTSLIAAKAVLLMLEAGFPKQVIHLITGNGREIGPALTEDHRVAGVVFTGSTITAQAINRSLASREIKPATLIAETGGQNAMIVDSTALPEQVAKDVIRSAFASAGQRCSALRVLFIQKDIADRVIELIQGAMQELSLGLPYLHQTDVGPVIDKQAKDKLNSYIKSMLSEHKLLAQVELNDACLKGDFVCPTAIEIDHLGQLLDEQFGPILHVIRFKSPQMDEVIEQINHSGFGLTMGIHSRNEAAYRRIANASHVGNCYINRDQVGAVVGVQPFGGQGLSGTGPKAGGPRYLYRFTKQKLNGFMADDNQV